MTMNDDEDDGDDGGDVNSHDDDVPKGVQTSGFSKCVKFQKVSNSKRFQTIGCLFTVCRCSPPPLPHISNQLIR